MAVSAINNNAAAMMMMAPNNNNNNGQMPNQMVLVGELLELAIKKTYRELMLLAELLPRKTDMERKIEIMLFANRNRQLYVRLLGLVRWASSASKVEKCSQIVTFLDKQSMLFTETADILARLSRETLVTARLPSFQLIPAVEVMTLGTYSRLPSCIRDRLVPPEAISKSDKVTALLRLNHIIQQRLVSSQLPLQMRNINIEFGRVTFTVQNEFQLTLTLMGDAISLPWRVLNVKILVEDKEINGVRDLVPQLQVYYLQNLIQSRLSDNPKPLVEAYNILHSFCLSLQLEVLHIQSVHLYYERLKDFIRIEEYSAGNRITISYWKDQDDKIKYKLTIEIDSSEPSKPLQIKHTPELHSRMFAKSMQANILSIEKLLFFTTHERSKIKLINLKRMLEEKLTYISSELSELPAVLHVSFIEPCMSSEQLLISVDMLTGQFLMHIPQYEDCPLITDLESNLNKNTEKVFSIFLDLRVWITRERCKKTVEILPLRIIDSLPLPPQYTHDILKIAGHKIYFQFTKHHDKCLMVVFDNESNGDSGIWIEYYLLYVSKVAVNNTTTNNSNQFELDTPKHYMHIVKTLHLDSANILHTGSLVDFHPRFDAKHRSNKRKLVISREFHVNRSLVAKRRKLPGYYIAELAHIVCFCEEKLSYSCMSSELTKRSVYHQVVRDDACHAHYIDVIKFPDCGWCPQHLSDSIQSSILSCTIRLQGKAAKTWNVLFVFAKPPIQTSSSTTDKGTQDRKVLNCLYDYANGSQPVVVKMVDELLLDWSAIVRLYEVVQAFANDLDVGTLVNNSLIDIKAFTYKKIVISYGHLKAYFVTIYYKSSEKRFQLSFGVSNQAPSNTNPHIMVATQLQQEFNQHLSIMQLLHVLNYTLNPLLTIQTLKFIPLFGIINARPSVPVLSFCVIPQSSTHVRLVYRNTYCLDIVMHPDNLISIRDGAYSQFDSKVVEELIPIQGLKTFLNKFIDKSVQMRRLSQTEDDNPPSPVTQLDSHDNHMFSAGMPLKTSPAKSSLMAEGASRNAVVNSIQHSNPHTPASPLTSVLNPHSGFVASPGAFASLSSPPSHPNMPASQQATQSGQVAPSPQTHGPDQSPATVFINSPMNAMHAPSPSFLPMLSPSAPSNFAHTHSPASQFMSQNTPQSGHDSIGSPFNQPSIPNPQSNMSLSSPAANIWPGSPSVSRPSPRALPPSHSPGAPNFVTASQHNPNIQSHHTNQLGHASVPSMMPARVLPPKAWAAAIPTLLTHQGFEQMCKASQHSELSGQCSSLYYTYSPLERFLGSIFLRRQFLRQIEENFPMHTVKDGSGIIFKNETMVFQLSLDMNTMQSLHLWVNSTPNELNQWSREELDTLQQYFENKVACAPYKPNGFKTFVRILNVPVPRILKDFIRLMRLELYPDQTLKWSMRFCLTIPPYGPMSSGPGMSAFLLNQNKILVIVALTRNPVPNQLMPTEQLTISVPLLYDMSLNTLQTTGERNNIHVTISNMFKRFSEFNGNNIDCILYPALREIMNTLSYP